MREFDRRSFLGGLGAAAGTTLVPKVRAHSEAESSSGSIDGPAEDITHRLGKFTVQWQADSERLSLFHKDHAGPLWGNVPGENLVEIADVDLTIERNHAFYDAEEDPQERCTQQHIERIDRDGNAIVVAGTLSSDSSSTPYVLRVSRAQQSQLSVELVSTDDRFNRVSLRPASGVGERCYGFGVQYNHLDCKGEVIPVLTQEKGIAREHPVLKPLVEANVEGASGSDVSTYAPMPYYGSTDGHATFLENTVLSVFDLEADERNVIRGYTDTLSARVAYGQTPLDRVEQYTEYAGRMRALPEWIHDGAIVGLQGGTEFVKEVWEELQARDTPISAFWLQDWVGTRTTSFGDQLWWNWELDRDQYPGWEQLVADLNDAGVDVLGYLNPYLADVSKKEDVDRNLFAEAAANGYLVENPDGEPYMLPITDFSVGIVDLTNPDAVQWYKMVIEDNVIGNGFRGWMADFGEGLPFDAQLHGGDAERFHNRYPVEWAKLNRELIDARNGDEVFFTRAGFTQSPAYSTLFWTGDHLVTWDDYDGFPTGIRGLLSSGMSGISITHNDAGGYTALTESNLVDSREGVGWSRSEELLKRWLEAAAFTAIYRTHEGNQPWANAQIYDSDELLDHFARFAKVYQSLAFYREELFEEAERRGWPVVRPLFAHYPNDPDAHEVESAFMLGEEFVVAPTLEPTTSDTMVFPEVDQPVVAREVYLPADRWQHLWTDEIYDTRPYGESVLVMTPVGEPPVFHHPESDVAVRFRENLQLWGSTEVRGLRS